MNKDHEWSKYFYFNKRERRGILALIFLILVYFLFSVWSHHKIEVIPNEFIEMTELMEELSKTEDSIKTVLKSPILRSRTNKRIPSKKEFLSPYSKGKVLRGTERFEFDPNNLSMDSLLQLGFSQFAVRNIIKYRENRGRFIHKIDMLKIFGIDSSFYNEISDYIRISTVASTRKFENELEVSANRNIQINNATKSDLQKLKGIGDILSDRIIKFRNSLGGFVKIEQLSEVYNLSDSTFQSIRQYISVDSSDISRININQCNLSDLYRHPYISKKNATIIINYRNQHGYFENPEELSVIKAFTEDYIEKLRPYIITP